MKIEQIGTLAELDVKPGDVVEWIATHRTYTVDENGILRHNDGGYISPTGSITLFRLISRATPKPSIDLTAIREPFGLLDKATQDAMIAHGGPYQSYQGGGWVDFFTMRFISRVHDNAIRVKPGPKRETVTNREMYITTRGTIASNAKLEGARPVTITYDTIDGVIDMATYRVVPK